MALAWSVLIGKLQTKVDLARRNALPGGFNRSCVICTGADETSSHLFLNCAVTWQIWMRIYGWMGLQLAMPDQVDTHFMQHGMGMIRNKKVGMALSMIWVATVGIIWNTRNNVIFRGEEVLWILFKLWI